MDGSASRTGVSEEFTTIRAGAGNEFAGSDTFGALSMLNSAITSGYFSHFRRGIMLFDTSSIGSNNIITSAIISTYGFSKPNSLGDTNITIVSSTPTSNTSLQNSDFSQLGTSSFASITYANFSTTGYNDFTLDSSGITNINKTGISKFGGRLEWDVSGTYEGNYTTNVSTGFYIYFAEQTGTSQDPKLVVTYTLPANPKQDVIWFD